MVDIAAYGFFVYINLAVSTRCDVNKMKAVAKYNYEVIFGILA